MKPKERANGGTGRKVETCKATLIKEGTRQEIDEKVAQEAVLRVFLNDQEIVALSCTPSDEEHLAAGFLFSEGLLKSRDQIREIHSSEEEIVVRTHPSYKIPKDLKLRGVLTSGCGKGKTLAGWQEVNPLEDVLIDLDFVLTPNQVLEAMSAFEKKSHLFRETAGVHSAALADASGIVFFNEDIGRHNAVDKVLGQSFLEGIELKGKFLVISGRISSDILSKLWHCGLSIVASRTAPTSLAVRMAQRLGITLVGFVRGRRMTIYSFPARVRD